jgi:hypothetical protein
MLNRRYNPCSFRKFIFDLQLSLTKISKLSGIPLWKITQIHNGWMKDRPEIREQILNAVKYHKDICK